MMMKTKHNMLSLDFIFLTAHSDSLNTYSSLCRWSFQDFIPRTFQETTFRYNTFNNVQGMVSQSTFVMNHMISQLHFPVFRLLQIRLSCLAAFSRHLSGLLNFFGMICLSLHGQSTLSAISRASHTFVILSPHENSVNYLFVSPSKPIGMCYTNHINKHHTQMNLVQWVL